MRSPVPIVCGRDTGFSLIEILCAVLLLGTSLVVLMGGITASLSGTQSAERLSRAVELAAERVEILQADGYLFAGDSDGVFDEDGEIEELAAWSYEESIAETELDGLYEVTVRVLHQSSEVPVYELETLLFDMPYTVPGVDTDLGGGTPRTRQERMRAAMKKQPGASR